MTGLTKLAEVARLQPEFREHLDQIIKGPCFKGSHRSQEFLKHIVERSLRGESESLRERDIGIELFGRPADYDTAEDAIVRVTASDVRKRLLQHYGKTGGDSRFRIDLPSGTYVPEFRSLSVPNAEIEPIETLPPASPIVVAPRWRLREALAVGLLLVLTASVTWWVARRRLPEPPAGANLISAAFQGTPGSLQVVVSDDALVLIQALLGHRYTLEEYENLRHLSMPELVEQKGLQGFWRSLSTRQITNLGDLQNAARIADNMRRRNWNVTIRHARQINAREFRSGNFIILGSSFSNPWADLFQVPTNFPFEESRPASILNRHPLSGEPATFEVQRDEKTGRKITYARVTLVENGPHAGRVVLVAGLSTAATEMAGEFLLRNESVARIRQALKLTADSPIPNLEMVLRVAELNEIGDSVELASCRRLGAAADN